MPTTPSHVAAFIKGLRVSRPWKGHGSAIFLELGELKEVPGLRNTSVTGEACISIEWDWRLELGASIVGGSSNSGPHIHACLKHLRDATIESLAIEGLVPELVVRFSTGHVLRSMAMLRGDPQWSIKVRDGEWLSVKDGKLQQGNFVDDMPVAERDAFALAKSAALRWGASPAPTAGNTCKDCRNYVALDGTGHLLDYGCCVSGRSPFDGRAVYFQSGCPAFEGLGESQPAGRDMP